MDLPRNNNGDVSFVARALRMWLAANMIPHKVFASDCGRSLHTVRDWIYGKSIPSDYNCELIIKVINNVPTYGDTHKFTNQSRLQSMCDADRHYRIGLAGHPFEDMLSFKNSAFFI
tara:strand:- start:1507 stop:1854 length:348 start_codon:yes stop_codon:yes gene_type:complete